MKSNKRKMQAAETRKKIIEAARDLFTMYGYDDVTIEDIVKKAGVVRGSFYAYFLSKEDVSVYLMMEGLSSLQDEIKRSCDNLDKNLPASELIVATACSISAMAMNMGVSTIRTIYKIFLERSAATGTKVKDLFEMPILFTKLYDLGYERGEFDDRDAYDVADKIKTILIGLTIEWCLYHENYDFIGKTRSLVTDYVNSLKK